MKKVLINGRLALFSILSMFIGISCNKLKDFGDTNVDPSTITQGDAAGFLTSTLANIPSTTLTPGIYMQYFMESQYPGTCYYSDNSSSFTGYYSGILSYLKNIIELGSKGSATNNMVQVAKILQQYIYFNITNQWGDVPYSEALEGSENTKPSYDEQKDIYSGIISKVDSAVNAMDESTISGDIAYSGEVDSWKKFGNSLLMLAAIQMSNVYPGSGDYAAQVFNKALTNTGGYITSNDENFSIVYPGNTFQNPWYSLYFSRSDYGESETLTDLMSSLGDNRQIKFGGANTTIGSTVSSSLGLPYGVTRDEIVNWTSANPTYARILRGDYRNQTSEMPLLTSAYVTLIRAEAAELGWTSEVSSDLYKKGIQLSFDYWDETMPSDYMSQSNVALGSDNIKKIAIQQYIAAYPNGLFAWNIWRKTGYPVLTPSPNASNESKQIPRRLKYSTAEATSNPDSYNEAVSRLDGGNSDVAHMWWDQ